MTGRFPGARTVDEFWANLRDGVESITVFSDEELVASGEDPELIQNSDYIKAGAILDDPELFDAAFFGFNPREAEVMDPQHRLFLECAWEVLELAGYDAQKYAGRIGVYAGVSINRYLLNLYSNPGLISTVDGFQLTISNDKDFVPTRVSYKLNLTGPSINVQTACSTSLVAVCLACQSLLSGETDMALAGGASIKVPQKSGALYQEGGILSPDGHCRAFDAKAQGTAGGRGVGIVVVKRLADALADGDDIQAVIKGFAMNNDGALKIGYTAPSVQGQAAVIEEALSMAGVHPETISYIEAHGTGTALGDPIEIAALTRAFRASTRKKSFCAVGSVKTNIGHLDTTSGVAGLIKTVLSLKHKQLPPSLHFERPNPQIDFVNSPFYVNAQLRDWNSESTVRRAGVSSFGIGGTNAHVVLEEAPVVESSGESRPWQLLLLSAKTETALDSATENLAQHFKLHPEVDLADAAYTLKLGRRAFAHRRMVVCNNNEEAINSIVASGQRRADTGFHEGGTRAIAFMFPGGGAQHVHMGAGLYQSEPIFREQLELCAAVLKPLVGYHLLDYLYPARERIDNVAESMKRPSNGLPALFAVEYALAQLWMSWVGKPQAMIGHSLGEYAAACLAGVFSLEDALSVVVLRAKLFEELPRGAMLSINLAEEELRAQMDERLSVAAVNGPTQCVASGVIQAIDEMAERLSAKGVEVRRIQIDVAAHSQMVSSILPEFSRFLETLNLQPPSIPFVSNVTGTWITAEQATDASYWTNHMRKTVRFADGIREILAQPDHLLLEVGPGQTLSTLAKLQTSAPLAAPSFSSLRHPDDVQPDEKFLLTTMGKLWLAGADMDWASFYKFERRRRIALPTYPFERQRYWVERQTQDNVSARHSRGGKNPDIAEWFYIPSWKRSMPRRLPGCDASVGERSNWLVFADECGLAQDLVERLRQGAQTCVTVIPGQDCARVQDGTYSIDPRRSSDYHNLLKLLAEAGQSPQKIVHCWTVTANEGAPAAGVEYFDQAQACGYYSLLYLAQASVSNGRTDELEIAVLSNHLHHVMDEDQVHPELATLSGLCKVIQQEYPHITCLSIDLIVPEPGTSRRAKLIDQCLADIKVKSSDHAIAYRGSQRLVQTYEKVRLDDHSLPARRLRESGVYFIIGGLGKIGLLLAEFLARTARARLVLLSRSTFPERAEWEHCLQSGDEQENVNRVIRKLLAIEQMGGEVLTISSDVADEEQMQAAMTLIDERFGEIDGVIHAAGVLKHKSFLSPLSEIGHDESEVQFSAKVHGLYVLESVLRGRQLDFCFLLSSNASVLGGLGFAAYAAANSFLDAFAADRSKAGDVAWISSNWDGWRDQTASQQAMQTSMDEYAMTPTESTEAFRRALTLSTVSQIVVSAGDLETRLNRWIRREFVHAPSPEVPIESLHARPALRNTYVSPQSEIERGVTDIWQALLGIKDVGIHDNFFELGGHSLMATRLMSRVRDTFRVELPMRNLFESPTIASLAERIEAARTGAHKVQAPPIVPVKHNGHAPLSFAQQRMWVLNQLEGGNPAYNLPGAVRITGPLCIAALQQTLTEIVRRHPTLRTRFAVLDEQPVQIVAPAGPLLLPLADLRELPSAEREAEIRRLSVEEALRPFDLAQPPLLRATVLRSAEDEHVALFTMHHIASDGWSQGVLFREVSILYAAYSNHQASPLPDLPIHYADFAVWQRHWLQGEVLEQQLSYWKQQLAGLPVLSLATTYPRSALRSFGGRTRKLVISRPLTDALNALSRAENVTLFMLLLAGFQILLHYYTGQEDLVVGTDVANRNRAETEGLIGFFVNQLVLRTLLDGNPSFRELLRRVKEVTLGAYAHQDLPFDKLVSMLQPEREPSRHPLFDVKFVLHNTPMPQLELSGLALRTQDIENKTAKFDLLMNVMDTEQGLTGSMEYSTELFTATTIVRMLGHYVRVLQTIVRQPEVRLSALTTTLAQADRQQQSVLANDLKEMTTEKFKTIKRRAG